MKRLFKKRDRIVALTNEQELLKARQDRIENRLRELTVQAELYLRKFNESN